MIRLPTELNEVIKQGGAVIVPSRQRAHAARLAYAAAELAQGRRVWATPDILTVDAWFTRAVERHAATADWPMGPLTERSARESPAGTGTDVPRILSPAEEWFLWRQCAAEATGELELVNRGALAEALRRASAIAADFGIDIRGQRPELSVSGSEDGDMPGTETALLAEVQRAVDERCQLLGAATVASLVARLPYCEQQVVASGFLTLPPRLRSFVSSSGEGGRAGQRVVPNGVVAADELDELERIARWCRERVASNPDVRILVALPGAPGTRERLATLIRQAVNPANVFQPSHGAAADGLVVIEGGSPLARVPSVAHALSTLSWLGGNAGDFEAVSAWLRAPYWQAPSAVARARLDLWLRERERMRFNLHQLVGALTSAPSALALAAREVSTLINQGTVALGQGSASPREWSERFRAVLEVFGWPGERARGSGEQQTVVRLHELLDEFGQLAAAARSISRDNAIQWFSELATRTAFRPADDDAVITISSTLSAPVVRYDAIWVAGLHAEAFPQPVQPDPFLPLAAQLAAGVPAASAAGRLTEAQALLASWREGADELVLSAPARADDLELLPSPLLAEWLHTAHRAPPAQTAGPSAQATAGADLETHASAGAIWLPLRSHREGMLESVEDTVGPPWPIDRPLPSGTRSLELQNQCPFRAYAELRLGSTPLDAPEPGIAADQRGQLLHAALQKLWERLRDSQGLAALSDAALDAAIHRSVEDAANEAVRRSQPHKSRVATNDAQGDLFGDPGRTPALSRECRRAVRLIRALCVVERERAPFRVESTELDSTLTLKGAQLRIRIDRVDALETGGRAILDYKSGRRTPADWYGERPSHPQLLAYLAALGADVVAMATANVTAREVRFDGIANVQELLPKLRGVEGPFGPDPDAWPLRRQEWLSRVENLAVAFLAGRAVVDPKPGACDYCHVASVCRIADRVAVMESDVPPTGFGDD